MCIVSDKIKFCTCSDRDVSELNHYWILHRKVYGKDLRLIGEPVFAFYKELSDYASNDTILCNRLYEKDAFDKPIQFIDNDHFEVVFNHNDVNQDRITHCFVYKKGKWTPIVFDTFDLMNKFDEIDSGTFENTFIDSE